MVEGMVTYGFTLYSVGPSPARVDWGPLMGPGRIHGPDLVCERSTRNVGFDDDNLISSTLTTSLDDLTRRRLYFQSSLSFGRDGLCDQQTITLAFSQFLNKAPTNILRDHQRLVLCDPK
jgi:hypothetical protein